MFEAILKYGSYIVDELRRYTQPVFVYIPPHGELRGGAWVVLDSSINPDQMEMYCDELGKGGVLEPQGLVAVKYRERDLLATMARLDATHARLSARIAHTRAQQALGLAARTPPTLSADDTADDRRATAHAAAYDDAPALPAAPPAGDVSDVGLAQRLAHLEARLAARRADLLPIYQQVAVSFAALHDTPGRMHAKGVVAGVLRWAGARRFFGARLRRRLAEDEAAQRLCAVSDMSLADARAALRTLYASSGAASAAAAANSSSPAKSSSGTAGDASPPTLSRSGSASPVGRGSPPPPGAAAADNDDVDATAGKHPLIFRFLNCSKQQQQCG
jgi:acetyl-CoA carboxylase/biotin carboxylase 1